MTRIQITAGAVICDTATGRRIADALPLSGAANRLGEEIYFGRIDGDTAARQAAPDGATVRAVKA